MNATRTVTATTPEQTPEGSAPQASILTQPATETRAQAPGVTGTQTALPGAAVRPSTLVRLKRWRSRRTVLAAFAGMAGLACLIAAGARWWAHAADWVKTDNAYVAARVHTVSARVAGTVSQLMVDDNQPVADGAVLARLEPADFDVKCRQAQAQVAQARAQTRQAQARIAQAEAQVARAAAEANKARLDLTRAQSLYGDSAGAISRQEFDQAQTAAAAAEAALQAAGADLDWARASAGAAGAQEEAAEANLEEAQLQRGYTDIIAPVAGRLGRKNIESGNRVQPGQALLAIVEPEVWLTANFKETQLERMMPGNRAEIRLDAFPGRRFHGRVESLAPASGAQFALLPPDNATGNFTRIVQRVPVKITLDAADIAEFAGRLMPGMSAIVEVKVRE